MGTRGEGEEYLIGTPYVRERGHVKGKFWLIIQHKNIRRVLKGGAGGFKLVMN